MSGIRIFATGDAAAEPMVALRHVTKRYPRGPVALHDITWEVPKGSFAVVTGPVGSGKSTLIKVLSALEAPTQGEVFVAGCGVHALRKSDVAFFRRRIGVVTEEPLFLTRTAVLAEVGLPLDVLGLGAREVRRRARAALEAVGLVHRASHTVDTLSQGERHLVALARALAADPVVLLADEPTARGDPEARAGMIGLLTAAHARGMTLVVVTQDPALPGPWATHVATLDHGRLRLAVSA